MSSGCVQVGLCPSRIHQPAGAATAKRARSQRRGEDVLPSCTPRLPPILVLNGSGHRKRPTRPNYESKTRRPDRLRTLGNRLLLYGLIWRRNYAPATTIQPLSRHTPFSVVIAVRRPHLLVVRERGEFLGGPVPIDRKDDVASPPSDDRVGNELIAIREAATDDGACVLWPRGVIER